MPADPQTIRILNDTASVQKVAKKFSELADAYAARLKTEAPNLNAMEVYVRLQDIERLRSFGSQLLFQAAQSIINDATDDQTELEKDLMNAKTRLEEIKDKEAALDLMADLLVLAGALVGGKPGPIVAALKEVREDIKST